MKKMMITLAILAFSTSAYAETIDTTTQIGGGSYTPSAKVGISIMSAATAYSATACHVNGKNQYGTSGGTGITGTYADTSKIYRATIPTQQTDAVVCAPTAVTAATALPTASWQ